MKEDGEWVLNKKACEFYGVTGNTLRSWASKDKIKFKRIPSGNRVYWIPRKGITGNITQRHKYIYARVSSSKQRNDLVRQSEKLRNKYPDYTLVTDIGSGLNYKRRGLLKLLEQSNKRLIECIVVSSKDRLCRFGFELLEWQFLQNNTKLVVLEDTDKTPEQEFTEDILAILQVFACRWNGKRRYRIENTESKIALDIDTKKQVKNVE